MHNKFSEFFGTLSRSIALVIISPVVTITILCLALVALVNPWVVTANVSVLIGLFALLLFIAIMTYTLAIEPLARIIRARLNGRDAAHNPANELLLHASTKFISAETPSHLRAAIMWDAQMAGDMSAAGVENSTRRVTEKCHGGVSKDYINTVLAIHEAGHATVALALGHAVVNIERAANGGTTYSLTTVHSPSAEDIWENLLITVAGARAEAMYSEYGVHFVSDGPDDREISTDYITALLFAQWTPSGDVASTFDGLLRAAQDEAERILTDYQPLHDELTELSLANASVGAQAILDVAKKHIALRKSDVTDEG